MVMNRISTLTPVDEIMSFMLLTMSVYFVESSCVVLKANKDLLKNDFLFFALSKRCEITLLNLIKSIDIVICSIKVFVPKILFAWNVIWFDVSLLQK